MKHRISSSIFGGLATLSLRAPGWVIAAYCAAGVASAYLAATRLELRTGQNDLVAADLPYNRRYLEFEREFGDLEFLYVVIVAEKDPELAARAADAVAEEVGKLKEHVEGVFHRVPPESFGDSVLLLAGQDELRKLAKAVNDDPKMLAPLEGASSIPALLELLANSLEASRAQANLGAARVGFKALDSLLASLATAADGGEPPALADTALRIAESCLAPGERGYVFTANGKLALVEIMPRKNYETLQVIQQPLAEIRSALDRVRKRFPEVQLGLTGRPVLQADEMSTTNQDMTVSTVLALVLTVGLFIAFFRRLRRPLLAALTLVVALTLTFGVVTLTIGYLTLLSIVFAVMLVGLGVEFGILLIARYQEELVAAGDVDRALRSTLLGTGMSLWTGGTTTAGAFYSTMLVDFKGLAELGFVAGTGLLICLLSMITLLPSLLVLSDRRIQARRRLHPPRLISIPALAHVARHPRLAVAGFAAITAAGLFGFRGIPYNSNLLELQAHGLESVEYEKLLIARSDHSTWYTAFIADSLEAVDRITAALHPAQEKGIVGAVMSIRDFVASDQEEKRAILKPAREVVAALRLPLPDEGLDPLRMRAALEGLLERLDHFQSLSSSRGDNAGMEAVKAIQVLVERVEALEGMLDRDPTGTAARLARYQKRWFGELRELQGRLVRLLDPPPITAASLLPEVRRRFVSVDGRKLIVYAFPKKDIWKDVNMEEFVAASRQVDPEVTGTPIQVHESARMLRDGFLMAGLYSLAIVCVLVFLDFRSLRTSCLALVPVLVGLLWSLQLMPLLGLEFNLANFFSLPILIGCGVDGGVHMIHRFRETGSVADVGRTTGSAITLSALSNGVSFLAIGVARHQGLASLGKVTALGCATILIASVVLLPSVHVLLGRTQQRRTGQAGAVPADPVPQPASGRGG